MGLLTFLRFLGSVVIILTVVCVGAGAFGIGTHDPVVAPTFFIPTPSFQDVLPTGRPDGPEKLEYQLLDRTTGTLQTLALPGEQAWSMLSVSPWRDPSGNVEAAGRWVSREESQEPFCGLGLLNVPEMTVKTRIPLDVLPIGKPCWVPGRSGEVLFSAGDGQLYRCNVSKERGSDEFVGRVERGGRASKRVAPTRLVSWATDMPGSGLVYLHDPFWSSEPAFRHIVFVSLSMLDVRKGNRAISPSSLWWLAMNDDGDEIEAAGPLAVDRPADPTFERMPTVVVRSGGRLNMVYLTRRHRQNHWRLRAAVLTLDPSTSRPRMESPREFSHETENDGFAPSSLVASASGEFIYAIAHDGRTLKNAIPD